MPKTVRTIAKVSLVIAILGILLISFKTSGFLWGLIYSILGLLSIILPYSLIFLICNMAEAVYSIKTKTEEISKKVDNTTFIVNSIKCKINELAAKEENSTLDS